MNKQAKNEEMRKENQESHRKKTCKAINRLKFCKNKLLVSTQ